MTQDQEEAPVQAVVMDALQHDGVRLEAGAQVALAPAEFRKLAALNVVALASDVRVPAAPADPAVDLKALIIATLQKLDPSDFEADGQPKLGAVKERLPEQARKITARLVAEVWAGLKPAG
jgi:hypothetical protein